MNQHEQFAAVYRFRRKYWEREIESGDSSFAVELERRMATQLINLFQLLVSNIHCQELLYLVLRITEDSSYHISIQR